MLNFDLLGSVYRVTYRMKDKAVQEAPVSFETYREALSFRGSCSRFIRAGIITSFVIEQVARCKA